MGLPESGGLATPPDDVFFWTAGRLGIGQPLDQYSRADLHTKSDTTEELKPPLASRFDRLFFHVLHLFIFDLDHHRLDAGVIPSSSRQPISPPAFPPPFHR